MIWEHSLWHKEELLTVLATTTFLECLKNSFKFPFFWGVDSKRSTHMNRLWSRCVGSNKVASSFSFFVLADVISRFFTGIYGISFWYDGMSHWHCCWVQVALPRSLAIEQNSINMSANLTQPCHTITVCTTNLTATFTHNPT